MARYYIQPAKGMLSPECFINQSRGSRFSLCFKVLFYLSVPSLVQNVNEIMKLRVNVVKKYKLLFTHISMGTSRGTPELMRVNSYGRWGKSLLLQAQVKKKIIIS